MKILYIEASSLMRQTVELALQSLAPHAHLQIVCTLSQAHLSEFSTSCFDRAVLTVTSDQLNDDGFIGLIQQVPTAEVQVAASTKLILVKDGLPERVQERFARLGLRAMPAPGRAHDVIGLLVKMSRGDL